MNQTTSPLLRLPRELRDKIFSSSIVLKKVFVLEDLSQAPIPYMSNVGLLASCRQINHEVKIQIPDTHMLSRCCCPSCCRFNHEAESLVPDAPTLSLRLGENIYPHRFFRANGENSGLPKYDFNWEVQVLEINSAFFKLFSTDSLHYYLHGNQPCKSGWLREIFPNLKRIEVHGYSELDLQHEILKDFQLENFGFICWGVWAKDSRVEVAFV